MDRMTAAEFAAWRHLLGLTLDELAAALAVNPRTTRAWESGRDPIPARVADELAAMDAEHRKLVAAMVAAEAPVAIHRDKRAGEHPRGWYVAAAARALTVEPDLEVDWL